MKTIDLLAKEGFNSMEALALLDGDDLVQTKIARGQQKLLLSVIRPLQQSHKTTTQSNMATETAATCRDRTARSTAADGQTTGSGDQGRMEIQSHVLVNFEYDNMTKIVNIEDVTTYFQRGN